MAGIVKGSILVVQIQILKRGYFFESRKQKIPRMYMGDSR